MRAASGGRVIIADVSISLDNVLAAGDAARASLGLFFVLVFSTALVGAAAGLSAGGCLQAIGPLATDVRQFGPLQRLL
jgi:hypothetical protein